MKWLSSTSIYINDNHIYFYIPITGSLSAFRRKYEEPITAIQQPDCSVEQLEAGRECIEELVEVCFSGRGGELLEKSGCFNRLKWKKITDSYYFSLEATKF